MNEAYHALDISGHGILGLGCAVEDVALFGVADCRRPPGMAEILWQDKNNENIESVPDSECPCED